VHEGRSAEWIAKCPYCNPEIALWREMQMAQAARGGEIIHVVPKPKAAWWHRDDDGVIRKKEGPF